MIVDTARKMAVLAADPGATDSDFKTTVREFLGGIGGAAEAEAIEAARHAAGAISEGLNERAAMVAMVAGALIERGFPPDPFTGAMVARFKSLVPGVKRLLDACTADIPADSDEPGQAFEDAVARMQEQMPDCAADITTLNSLFPPLIALFSASVEARAQARDLAAGLAAGAPLFESVHWLTRIASVLDDEPFIAIEPATRTGLSGRMSGISDNFQLHVLLMEAFPSGSSTERRVSESAAAIARGEGPQSSDETVIGCWNLYTWRALQADGSLPSNDLSASADWIWGEGTPSDIPALDGTRVILMGPPAYVRSWRPQRDFSAMKAGLGQTASLSRAQIDGWLTRINAARIA